MDRKQLIEDAAKAMYFEDCGVAALEDDAEPFREMARVALAVFEGAYTPTDDEREALWDAFDRMHLITEGGCDTRGDDVADMVLSLGFHRTVQGEPPCRYCGRPMSEHPGGVYCPAGPVQGDAKLPENSVQGEPGLRAYVRDLTGATDAELDELGGFQGEPSDDYEAGYAEGFHHGRSTPREPQGDQSEPSNCESDERVQAWEQIAKHSIFRRCYDDERPLITSILARLDTLKDLEETVNELAPAPRMEPSQAQVIAALEAYGYTKYDLIHPPGHRMYDALRAAAETGGER